MVLPYMKYPLIVSFSILTILFLINYKKFFINKKILFEFLKVYNPLLILVFFYSFGIINTKEVHILCIKDMLEFSLNLILLFYLFIFVHRSKQSNLFIHFFNKLTVVISYLSIIVAFLGLSKYLLNILGVDILINSPYGTAFNSDKNFYALFSFLGIVSLIPHLIKQQVVYKKIIFQLLILLLITNILFSFSYRAIFILILIILVIIGIQFFVILNTKNPSIINFSKNTRLLLVIFVLSFLFLKTNNLKRNETYKQFTKRFYVYQNNTYDLTLNAFHFDKWEYAIELYKKESIINKFFGSGFDYLEKFGEKFNNDKKQLVYPHNPILSALLYSGIIGAVFAFLFLLLSVYYGIIYFKKNPLYSLMLFTSLLFVFFSGNSLFSVPIFLFLFSLSFLIRYEEITELKIPNINKPGSRFIKESFDYIMAVILFIVLLPFLLLVAFVVLITMGWPILYSQQRIGQNGKMFRLYKFRTMNKAKSKVSVSASELERISKLGHFLRKSKIDELPELLNIIKGDMSFVGTRPDVPGYADKLEGDDRIILDLKPGLTGPASLKYVNEEELLSKVENPIKYNDEVIFPDKVRINKAYMKNWSFWLDIKIIIYTLLRKSLKDEFLQ